MTINQPKPCHRGLQSSIMATLAGLLLLGGTGVARTRGIDTGIAPINSKPDGKTYSEWAAAWGQWAFSIPADDNPIADTTGENADEGQRGPVWFLAGNSGGITMRECFVPEGKALFVPLLNYFWITTPGDPPATIKELRALVRAPLNNAIISCEIDGQPVHNPNRYREDSAVYAATLPENNLFGIDAGSYGPCLDNGYYLFLDPFKNGLHTIHFKGETADHSFSLDVTYRLHVGKVPGVVSPQQRYRGKTLTEWLSNYWRWYYGGADPAQSEVGQVQLLPLPVGELISGSGTPEDPALYRGGLEITLHRDTAFVLPAFGLVGESYDNGTPDDAPIPDATVLAGVHPDLTIDGRLVLSDENKADFYIPATTFVPPVTYAMPTSYHSISAIFFEGGGMIGKPLEEGVHVIHIYEPFIIPGLFGLIYDNTWVITVKH